MKRLIPKPVKMFLRPVVQYSYNFLKSREIRNLKISPPDGDVALSYAGMLPVPGTVVSGGRVKLSHLGEVYPEQKSKFSILYLVSSSLPTFAAEWVETCKKAGVKIVWNQNGVGYPGWAGDDYESVNSLMKKLIRLADWVIYQSNFCKVSADKFLGEFGGPHSIIYNCVDTAVFSPMPAGLPVSPLRLLVMGSHNQSYRVLIPLETLSVLIKRGIPARLKIAGKFGWPNAEEEIKSRINSLNLSDHVEIFGPYLQEDAPDLYRESHILLHPKYNDACPTVPIEAMACGVPVIGSGSGGVPELLGDRGGIAVKTPQSWDTVHVAGPEVIADAVSDIMEDWPKWSVKARMRAEQYFSREKWLEEHERVFGNLTRRRY